MNQEYNNKLYKKTLMQMILTVFIIFSVYSLVMTPLYEKTQTDISFRIPVLVDIMPVLTNICEIAGIVVAYSYLIYTYKQFGKKQINIFIVSFVALTFYKYLVKYAVGLISNGPINFKDLFLFFIIQFILEVVQLFIVVLIINSIMKKALTFIKMKTDLSEKLNRNNFDTNTFFFPFVKIFSKKNPLQKAAFWSSFVIMASKMLQYLEVDIITGLPVDLVDFLWMLTAYISCVVLGLASYLLMIWILIKLNISENKFINR